jgi:hypothetical protein
LNDFLGSGKFKRHWLTLDDKALGLCEAHQFFWRVAVKVGYEDAFNRPHETMVSFHYYVPHSANEPLVRGFYQEHDPATNYNT